MMDQIRPPRRLAGAEGRGFGIRILTGVYYIMMEDCVAGFLKNGAEVLYPGVRRSAEDPRILYSEDAFRKTLIEGRFDVFFTINAECLDVDGLLIRELIRQKKRIVIWYVDDPFNPFAPWNVESKLPAAASDYEGLFLFCIDERFVEKLKSRGFANVFYLPHATSLAWAQSVRPVMQPPSALATHVSHLDLENLPRFEEMLTLFPEPVQQKVRDFVDLRLENLCLSWEEFARDAGLPEIAPDAANRLEHTANRISTIRTKIHLVRLIEKMGINVYGFKDWLQVLKNPASYKCHVPYYHGLRAVYQSSFITLNITHVQLSVGVNQRVLDVPAGGGFLISDYRKSIREMFPREVIPLYARPQDLLRQIEAVVKKPESRSAQHEALMETIRRRHTYDHRMQTILDRVTPMLRSQTS